MPPAVPTDIIRQVRAIAAQAAAVLTIASDNRLPAVGDALVRQYKGRQVRVVVLEDGFEYDGQRYKSLSAVAKAISGSHCSGFRFFGLEGKR